MGTMNDVYEKIKQKAQDPRYVTSMAGATAGKIGGGFVGKHLANKAGFAWKGKGFASGAKRLATMGAGSLAGSVIGGGTALGVYKGYKRLQRKKLAKEERELRAKIETEVSV